MAIQTTSKGIIGFTISSYGDPSSLKDVDDGDKASVQRSVSISSSEEKETFSNIAEAKWEDNERVERRGSSVSTGSSASNMSVKSGSSKGDKEETESPSPDQTDLGSSADGHVSASPVLDAVETEFGVRSPSPAEANAPSEVVLEIPTFPRYLNLISPPITYY
jgi:hypothetical protein